MDCFHQPMLIASEEIIPDKILRNELIENCWLQREWSPSIGPNGVFFCEVAQSYDMMFGDGKGLPVEVDWWKKDLSHYQDQIDTFCNRCSVCIPLESVKDDTFVEYVSPQNYERLLKANSPYLKRKKNAVQIYDKILNRDDISKMKFLEKKNSENRYIDNPKTENYYFFQHGRVDTRLGPEEEAKKIKQELIEDARRIRLGRISINERLRLGETFFVKKFFMKWVYGLKILKSADKSDLNI